MRHSSKSDDEKIHMLFGSDTAKVGSHTPRNPFPLASAKIRADGLLKPEVVT